MGWPEEEDTGSGDLPTRVATAYLVVMLDRRAVEELPPTGKVTIGRSRAARIFVDHPSVSREHGVLDVDAMTFTDLGSRNGTTIGGERIAPHVPVTLHRGDSIVIGEVTIFVQNDRDSLPAPTYVQLDLPLEQRLVDETARAARFGSQFLHVRVHVPAVQADAARDVLVDGLRSSDVLTEDGPGRFQLLLPALTGDRGRPVVQRLATTLERHGIPAQTGIACYPHDGVTAAQLSARAREMVASNRREPTAIDDVMRLAASVADTDLTVLVNGETGVGKELVAEMIHRISPRRQRPFLRINCAAIAEPLLESELFGHARGAFTGADAARVGLFETANGGTVLLDEIGEMSLRIQATLLRVLEEHAIRRVGESESREVDVRIVCATNRSLVDEVDAGRFRRDLYFRISAVALAVPPLRERLDSIEPIARAFIALAAARGRRGTPALTADAIAALRAYHWPGNVRELRNAIERAVLLAAGGPIRADELGLELGGPTRTATMPALEPATRATLPNLPRPDARALSSEIADLERKRILEALDQCGGNQTQAARALGLSRSTLIARMEAYAVRRPRKRD